MRLTKTSQKIKEQKVVTTSTSKRIGYFAALLIVMGSSIGSGIFFKSGGVMSNVENSIVLALLSWIVAAFTVIAMAIALIDIAAQSKKDDRGLLSWVKKFNGLYVYKSAKNLFIFFTLPIKFFVLPVYFFQSLQTGLMYTDATWVDGHIVLGQLGQSVANIPWWAIFIVVIGIDIYFMIVNGISTRAGSFTNRMLMYIKFVPLLFAFLIGFIILGINGGLPQENHWWVETVNTTTQANPTPNTLVGFSPAIGVFMSLASVFFAFDGFYVAAGIQSQLKEPKKISSILLFGLLIVTAIYLSIALSMTFGAAGGKWANVGEFFVKHNVSWIYSIMAILIAVGILGILNGYSMWAMRLYQVLVDSREIPLSKYLMKLRTKSGNPLGGRIFIMIFGLIISVTCALVSALVYHVGDKPLIDNVYQVVGDTLVLGGKIGLEVNGMYAFADMISNWQTMFTFAFITAAIASSTLQKCKINSKTKRDWITISAGWISVVIITIALGFQFAQPIANLAFVIQFNDLHPNNTVIVFPHICLVVILVVALTIAFVPSIFEYKNKTVRQIFELEDKIWNLQREKEVLNQRLQSLEK